MNKGVDDFTLVFLVVNIAAAKLFEEKDYLLAFDCGAGDLFFDDFRLKVALCVLKLFKPGAGGFGDYAGFYGAHDICDCFVGVFELRFEIAKHRFVVVL